MLTNLKWIVEGEIFPPVSERKRLDMYHSNRELFESEHASVYEADLRRIERVVNNFNSVVSYPVILNFQKLMSLKICDLLLGEPPTITAKDTKKQLSIDTIMDNSHLLDIAYQAAIDASRYGDGLFYVHKKGDKGVIDLTQPCIWYPVVSEDNIKDKAFEVLAWRVGEDRLKVSIHSKGNVEEREYAIEGNVVTNNMIGKQTKDAVAQQTGLDDFAIVQVSNTLTSDRVTGIDDYTDIDSIIADIMVRIGQIDRILDKHASPSVSGPTSALERDTASGEYRLKMGNYFPRDGKDDPNVEYITWDGQLAANFTQIEKLINLLATISEMGTAIFGDNSNTGTADTASKLKLKMTSALAKVGRLRNKMDTALKTAIVLCSQLGGKNVIKLDYGDVSIKWADGIMADDKELADIMAIRTGNKPTISQISAIKILDGMDDEAAEAELEAIQEDEMQSNPLAGIPSVATAPANDMPMDNTQPQPPGKPLVGE